jgi:hypothetical protein
VAISQSEIFLIIRARNLARAELHRLDRDLGGIHRRWGTVASAARITGRAVAGGAIVAAIGLGKAAFMAGDFEQKMNVLAKVSQASRGEMAMLSKLAIQLGNDIKLPGISAMDATDAMLELSKAGLSVTDVMGASRGVLQLATAGELDVADAAKIAANASQAEVHDVALAAQQAATSFHQAKQPVDAMVTSIALMANAGIRGSDAGTSLKVMLQRLEAPTKKAKKVMDEYGLAVFDAHGKTRPLRDIIRDLEPVFARMTDAQRAAFTQTVFGTDAMRAANIVLGGGTKAWDAMHTAVTKANAAQELAAARTKGFKGALEALKNMLSTAALIVGNAVLPKFTEWINWVTQKGIPSLGGLWDKLTDLKDILDILGPKAALKNLFPASLAGTIDKIATAGGNLVDAAKKWAGLILSGINQGLKTGHWGTLVDTAAKGLSAAVGNGVKLIGAMFSKVDWKQVGSTLNAGFVKLIEGIGNLGSAIVKLFGKVDWFSVGTTVGKNAAPFMIAFMGSVLDPGKLFEAIKKHPFDFVAGLLAILGVGKIGGAIAKVLRAIPFLKVFAPLFEGLHKLTNPINRAIGGVLKLFGEGFLAGFREVFPRVGKLLGDLFDGKILGAVRRRFGDIRKAGADYIRSLGRGMGQMFGLIIRDIGQLIGFLTKPFRPAGSWLISAGLNLLRGLRAGIGIGGGATIRAIATVIRFLLGPFRPAAGWLISAGLNLLRGLRAGIAIGTRAIGGVLRTVKDAIVDGIKRLFGISSPSTVMQGIGANLVGGLVKGLVTNTRNLRGVIKSLGVSTRTLLGAALGGAWDFVKGKWQQATSFVGGLVGAVVKGTNVAIVKGVASRYGWGSGAQWNALSNLIMGESGFRNTAQNPTSTAYGMFQFLNSTWAGVGGHKTSDPFLQAVYGLRYIAQRYGSPIAAYSAWQSRSPHWYARGGVVNEPTLMYGLRTGQTGVMGESGAEAIVPLGTGSGGGHLHVHFHGPVYGGKEGIRQLVEDIHQGLIKKQGRWGGVKLGLT